MRISGQRCLGSSCGKGLKTIGVSHAQERADALRKLQNCDLLGVADIGRLVFFRHHQPVYALDQIRDVAETARLPAVSIDGDGLAGERLVHEVRQGAAIVEAHPRAIRIKDAHDVRIHAVITVVGHGHGFGESFGFVVNAARADRIHIAPIGFRLR